MADYGLAGSDYGNNKKEFKTSTYENEQQSDQCWFSSGCVWLCQQRKRVKNEHVWKTSLSLIMGDYYLEGSDRCNNKKEFKASI